MRVRHLQSYLTEHGLLKRSSTEDIKNLKLGIDALYFLRASDNLKDILSDVSGCISPCIFHLVDKQCDYFRKYNIDIIFVFDGITPKSHKLFSAQYQQNIEQGWVYYVNNELKLSYEKFSQVSNICNSYLAFILFHYLKSKGYKCIYAPYLAISQLSYFLANNIIDTILGPPTLILYNPQNVIINIIWEEKYIEWIDLNMLLKTWNINKEQFIDACLLAGTEYCLTFPYLNLSHFNSGNSEFNFGNAIEFIKQSPLISYLQHFPNDQLKKSYIEGYRVCKSILKFPIVLLLSGEVGFFSYKDKIFYNTDNVYDNNLLNKSDQVEKIKDENYEDSEYNKSFSINGNLYNLCNEKIKDLTTIDTLVDSFDSGKVNYGNRSTEPSKINEEIYTDNLHYMKNNVHIENGKESKQDNSKKHDSDCKGDSIDKENNSENGFETDENINMKENYEHKKNKDIENEDQDSIKIDDDKNEDMDYEGVPHDYIKVIGSRFPTCVYYLMSIGLLSKKILCVLAQGEWIDYTHPILDSFEYRDALIDLREYRCRILGLISVKLNPYFYKRKIKFFDYGYYINNILEKNNKFTYLDISLIDGFLWNINKNNIIEETKRQNNKHINLQFILKWHLYCESMNVSLVCKNEAIQEELSHSEGDKNLDKNSDIDSEDSRKIRDNSEGNNNENEEGKEACKIKKINKEKYNDKIIKNYNNYYKNILNTNNQNFNSILCIVYYMFLENLGIFTKRCGVTLFGLLLSESKNKSIDNNILIIFELLKFGFLTTQPLLPPNGKKYPENAYSAINNSKHLKDQDKKSVLLLSRIYSLYSSNTNKEIKYDGLIDFDLCAFFSVVKIIKKTLRQLMQACIANVLITNMELIHLLPDNLYNQLDSDISYFFVTDHLMGVLTKYFLLFDFDDLKNEIYKHDISLENYNQGTVDEKGEDLCITNNCNGTSDIIIENNNEYCDHINKVKNTKDGKSFSNSADDGINTNKNIEEMHNIKNCSAQNNQELSNELGKNTLSEKSDIYNNNEEDKDNTSSEDINEKHDNKCNNDSNKMGMGDENVNSGTEEDKLANKFNIFEKAVRKKFPSFLNPIIDLCNAINTWRDHLNLIIKLENHTNVYDLVSDMKAANSFLEKKIQYIGLDKCSTYIDICSNYNA
ncbi:conserved Plasmodium protein, unknown function [Plasmodium berghei]|uniref:Exonuclease 1 n=2 Tax=Plasmodium berghei TaxID=5821 RepID=A0A509ALQ1_PLABA|nr:MKT1 domain-containing protein, putative [Plasmodium berghei ANKA]CXI72696.1 conserved Plasmodium protein, unknown function [Plasmodium berghei]SCM24441.1 conserved Plasmodium protein, unknown function [Plasmodium berghei]SCN27064.1 conserved Plasmodium protein, unknown function [Plasmodium berghei]SCO61546.1 conserved Plasmodium protein, unknown function [Plasmodium berghei]SCO63486.1 conserved Plasmodium protein, unknown function [Plasmodium berghei]|eukprot:XP_034422698.1 MKT1 domain-containing protein, putative [Plasmodium berghei ANKA]